MSEAKLPSKEQALSYVEDHKLQDELQSALNAAIREKVPDPLDRIADLLHQAAKKAMELNASKSIDPPMLCKLLCDISFEKTKTSSFSPMRPTAAEMSHALEKDMLGKTDNGPFRIHGGVVVQKGPFNALWMRCGLDDSTAPRLVNASLQSLLELLLKVSTRPAADQDFVNCECDKHALPTALYVGVSQRLNQGIDLQWLADRNFKFYRFQEYRKDGKEWDAEIVYVCEPYADEKLEPLGLFKPSCVPPYSTAYEGVHAMLLSPDEKEVLLQWEGGGRSSWGTAGGHVEMKEGLLDGVIREIQEEVNVKVDLTKGVKVLGGHQTPASRDNHMNSTHKILMLTALDKDFKVDGVEVEAAHWFKIEDIVAEWVKSGCGKKFELPEALRKPGHEKKLTVSGNNIKNLQALAAGKYLEGGIEPKDKKFVFGAQWAPPTPPAEAGKPADGAEAAKPVV